MKHRLIDTALLAGLGIIAAVIAFALLNLGRQPRPKAVTAASAVQETAAAALPVLPELPQAQAEPPEAIEDQAEEPAAPGPTVQTSSRTVLLQQIGFSYVTGGAGACGIILEPWKHIAVSRDLLERYGCGTKVSVTLGKAVGGHRSFEAVIADTMSPSFTNTINVYIDTDEPAFEYGLLDHGTLTAPDQGG